MAEVNNPASSQAPLGVPGGREASLDAWAATAQKQCYVDPGLYIEYDVKRGLRDQAGRGVLAGLTRIGDVVGTAPGTTSRAAPALMYRAIEVTDLERFVRVTSTASRDRVPAPLRRVPALPACRVRAVPRGDAADAALVRARRDPRMPSRDIMNALMAACLALHARSKCR